MSTSTALAPVNGSHNNQIANLAEMMSVGKVMAASGYFPDVKSEAQAVVKIMAGGELGLGAWQSMRGIHIINGAPTIGGGLIASMIKRSPRHDYKIVTLTDERCEIAFFEDGQQLSPNGVFTMEDAKRAGLSGGNWAKFPRNMLFNRCISNGAKWHMAGLFGGPVYTPEEMGANVTFDAQGQEIVLAPEPMPQRAPSPAPIEAEIVPEPFTTCAVCDGIVTASRRSLAERAGMRPSCRRECGEVVFGEWCDDVVRQWADEDPDEQAAAQGRIAKAKGSIKPELIDAGLAAAAQRGGFTEWPPTA